MTFVIRIHFDLYVYVAFFFCRGDAFLESYIDGLARSQGPAVSGAEDEDQDGNLIRSEEKQFQDGEEFPDGRDFKFNNLSQVSIDIIHMPIIYSAGVFWEVRVGNCLRNTFFRIRKSLGHVM